MATETLRLAAAMVYFFVFVVGIASIEYSFGSSWGFVPTDAQLELLLGASFGLSGITVAVVGLLLSVWVAAKLYDDPIRKGFFQFLILSLTFAAIIGFTAGLTSLAVLGGQGSQEMREAVPYLFIATPYFISFGLVGSVLAILWS